MNDIIQNESDISIQVNELFNRSHSSSSSSTATTTTTQLSSSVVFLSSQALYHLQLYLEEMALRLLESATFLSYSNDTRVPLTTSAQHSASTCEGVLHRHHMLLAAYLMNHDWLNEEMKKHIRVL